MMRQNDDKKKEGEHENTKRKLGNENTELYQTLPECYFLLVLCCLHTVLEIKRIHSDTKRSSDWVLGCRFYTEWLCIMFFIFLRLQSLQRNHFKARDSFMFSFYIKGEIHQFSSSACFQVQEEAVWVHNL